MSSYSKVVIMGHLTRDPEIRQIGNTTVCKLGVAVSEHYRNAAGEKVEKPCYIDIDAWGEQATNCGKYLKKGRPVIVDGNLQMDEWEGKNGERRNKIKVRAQQVQFLSEGSFGGAGAGGGAGAKRPAGKPVAAGAATDQRPGEDDSKMPF